MCWFQIWLWLLKILGPNPQIWTFCIKKYYFSDFNKISSVPNFEGADFKSDIWFPNFWAQISKFGYFAPKCIIFLVLTKFLMYLISKVLTSNLIFLFKNFELKSPYSGILDQKYQLSNLNEVLPVSYFESADLKSHIFFPNFWAQIPKFCPFRPNVLTFQSSWTFVWIVFCVLHPKLWKTNVRFEMRTFEIRVQAKFR